MENFNTREQILNHITKNGKKRTSEKIFIKSFKEMQKNSTKQTKEILKIVIINATPVFKFKEFRNRNKRKKALVKRIPTFLSQDSTRFSQAIKILLGVSKMNSFNKCYLRIADEILNNASKDAQTSKIKEDLQKEVTISKRYLKRYRWRKVRDKHEKISKIKNKLPTISGNNKNTVRTRTFSRS